MVDISPLAPERYLESISRDGAVIGELCRRYPGRTVPTCPDWTGADVLAHLSAFAMWLRRTFAEPDGLASALPPVDPEEAVRDWGRTLGDLLTLLRDADPDDTVPNWSTGGQTAAFWLRRTAQDVAVHRWDAARLASATPEPVPADVARDGVGEYLDVFVTTAFAAGAAPENEVTVRLEMTDLGESVSRDLPHPGPVTTLRGTASDLLLGLWHRRDPRDLVADGDPAPIEAWPHI